MTRAPTRAEVALRPVTDDDRSSLLAVYASTREEELAPVAWSAGRSAAFVAMQFDAQSAHYAQHYPGGPPTSSSSTASPPGRLLVARWPGEIRIVDIALLPGVPRPRRGAAAARRAPGRGGREGRT